MSTRTVYLIAYRNTSQQRAHFAIWVPYKDNGTVGTQIHVVGTPMSGYQLEFKRVWDPYSDPEKKEIFAIGQIDTALLHDWAGTQLVRDATPMGNLEMVASQVPPPRANQNFMAPVNDVRKGPMSQITCADETSDNKSSVSRVDYGVHPPPRCCQLPR